jgi:biotin carboxyl carrier protein
MRSGLITQSAVLWRIGGLVILLVAVVGMSGCDKLALPHDAHATGDPEEPPMVSVTLAVEKLELFMEHPYLVQGEVAKFNVHLTVLQDGMPIRSGKLTVVAKGPSGKTTKVEQPTPRSPGIFGPAVAFDEAGENELSLILDSEQAQETIRVPLMVYADQAGATKAADDTGGDEPEGAITFLKEQAWKVGVVHEPVGRRRLVERLTVPGQVVPAAGARAVVTPPLAGRVLPPPSGPFPRVGQQVKAGDIVAVVEPPLAGPQGAELLVNRAQIQALETELAVKQMDVAIEISRAKIELQHAQLVHKRAELLSTQGSTAKKQAEDALRTLQLAEATYEGKLRLREPYEQARAQLRSMLDRPAAIPEGRTTAGQNATNEKEGIKEAAGLQLVLRAPVTGTVRVAQATEGEFVDATRPLFTIINLDRLWIEAKVSEYDLERPLVRRRVVRSLDFDGPEHGGRARDLPAVRPTRRTSHGDRQRVACARPWSEPRSLFRLVGELQRLLAGARERVGLVHAELGLLQRQRDDVGHASLVRHEHDLDRLGLSGDRKCDE